jgi:excisionase family DNA binding protein
MPISTILDVGELPVVLTMRQVQCVLGFSRGKTYELASKPGFPVVRVGKSLRVPRELLLKWLEQQASGEES